MHPFHNIVILVQFKLALDPQLLCSLQVLKGYQVFTMYFLLLNALILFFKFLLVVQMGEEYYHARDFSKALM